LLDMLKNCKDFDDLSPMEDNCLPKYIWRKDDHNRHQWNPKKNVVN
jgi:hypothetical protein